MSIYLEDLATPRARGAFFALPAVVYRDDPHHVAPFRDAEERSLDRPSFAGRQRGWVAFEDGRPVGRVVARLDPSGVEGPRHGFVGFFEALDRPAAVARLLAAAVEWLEERGAERVVGPMEGDTWHRYRFSVGPRDDPPFLLEPHHPPHYPRLWEANGFEPLEEYVSQRVEDPEPVAERLAPRLAAARDEGFRFEPLDLDRFEDELRRLYRLSVPVFEDNFLYRPIPEERFLALYAGARRLVDPRLVLFAVDADGADAGFLFTYPDRLRAFAALGGRRTPLAILRHLWARRHPVDTVNFKSLGVLPSHRRSHLASALLARGYELVRELGYRHTNHCLMRADNPSRRFAAEHGRLLRRYVLYRHRGTNGGGGGDGSGTGDGTGGTAP